MFEVFAWRTACTSYLVPCTSWIQLASRRVRFNCEGCGCEDVRTFSTSPSPRRLGWRSAAGLKLSASDETEQHNKLCLDKILAFQSEVVGTPLYLKIEIPHTIIVNGNSTLVNQTFTIPKYKLKFAMPSSDYYLHFQQAHLLATAKSQESMMDAFCGQYSYTTHKILTESFTSVFMTPDKTGVFDSHMDYIAHYGQTEHNFFVHMG